MMKHIVFLFLAVTMSGYAGQSIVMKVGAQAFTDPSMDVDVLWRAEMHIDLYVAPGPGPSDGQGIINLGGAGAQATTRTESGGSLALYDNRNVYQPVNSRSYCFFGMSGRTNVLVRWQRTPTHLICEIWNADGTGYEYQQRTRTAYGSPGSGGTLGSNQPNTPATHLAFFRLHEGNLPAGSRPPVTADVGIRGWKFDGNGTAQSGGNNINTGGFSFAQTVTGVGAVAGIAGGGTKDWMPFRPLRAGHRNQLESNGYSMADDTWEVECFWQQIPHAEGEKVTSHVHFDDRTSCTPTISGLVFGPYKFRLKVTDSDGRTATVDRSFGAVAYDDKGVVIYPDERLNAVLGPMLVLGENPWEWADRQSVVMAQHNWNFYEPFGGTWEPEWLRPVVNGVPRSGGILYRQAGQNTKVFGVGTNFLEVFCNGEPGPAIAGRGIVVYRPVPYRRTVQSCQSDEEITTSLWEHPVVGSPTEPNPYWGTTGFLGGGETGDWSGNDAGTINYYDNALAHYRLYYRSGWLDARTAARWLADRWIQNPYNTAGNASRDASWPGMSIRLFMDGGLSEYTWDPLPAMRHWAGNCTTRAQGTGVIDDVRESAYCLGTQALMALLDPDPEQRATFITNIRNGLGNRWEPRQAPEGNYYDNQSVQLETRSVTVANGSATVTLNTGDEFPENYCGIISTEAGSIAIDSDRVSVTGTGTDFTGTAGKAIYLRGTWKSQPWSQVATVASNPAPTETKLRLVHPWRGDPDSISDYAIMESSPNGTTGYVRMFRWANSDGTNKTPFTLDREDWYWCRRVSGTEITLDKPFTGDTSGGNVYRRRGGAGIGMGWSQPFYHGILGTSFSFAYYALIQDHPEDAGRYASLLGSTMKWLVSNDAVNPATKGLRYINRGHTACRGEDYSPARGCWLLDGSTRAERSYNIEAMQAMAAQYLVDPGEGLKTAYDEYYTNTYTKNGFSSPFEGDGNWAEATDEAGYTFSAVLSTKNYGQAWGMGGGQTWPAARLGGVDKPRPRMSSIAFEPGKVAGAVSARIVVQSPSGATVSYPCSASPCSVQIDQRQGDHLFWVQHLGADGKIIEQSEQQRIKVR